MQLSDDEDTNNQPQQNDQQKSNKRKKQEVPKEKRKQLKKELEIERNRRYSFFETNFLHNWWQDNRWKMTERSPLYPLIKPTCVTPFPQIYDNLKKYASSKSFYPTEYELTGLEGILSNYLTIKGVFKEERGFWMYQENDQKKKPIFQTNRTTLSGEKNKQHNFFTL
jgi:hypothetical protein